MIFENLELLSRQRAWLDCGVIASVLMFLIPERGNRRDPIDLILGLVCVIGIFLKMRPWLAVVIGEPLATFASIVLFFAFALAFILLTARRASRTNARPSNKSVRRRRQLFQI